jgi:hypothetical protein
MQMKGIGQNFDDFMIEQGLFDEAKDLAAKKLTALKLQQEPVARPTRQASVYRSEPRAVATYA